MEQLEQRREPPTNGSGAAAAARLERLKKLRRLGNLLKRHRELAGLSAKQLAIKADVGENTIYGLEGTKPQVPRHVPRYDTYAKIADALGLEPTQRKELDTAYDDARGASPDDDFEEPTSASMREESREESTAHAPGWQASSSETARNGRESDMPDFIPDLMTKMRQGTRPAWLSARWTRVAFVIGSAALIVLVALGIWFLAGGDSSPQIQTEIIGSGQCVDAPAGTIAVGRVTVNGVAQYTTDGAGATTGWIVQLGAAAEVCAPMSEGAILQGVGDNPDSIRQVLGQDVRQLQLQGCVVNQGCQRVVTIRVPYP